MKLLIVDDSAADVELLAAAMRQIGRIELSVVRSGIVATELLATIPSGAFDLILIDWRLPLVTGDVVSEAYLRRADRADNAPVVLLSSALPPHVRTQIGNGGALSLEKPVDLDGYDLLAARLFDLVREAKSASRALEAEPD